MHYNNMEAKPYLEDLKTCFATMLKPSLHISPKDRKHILENTFLNCPSMANGLHIVAMIASIESLLEILAIHTSTA